MFAVLRLRRKRTGAIRAIPGWNAGSGSGPSSARLARRRQRAAAPTPIAAVGLRPDSPAVLRTRGALDDSAPGTGPQTRRGPRGVHLERQLEQSNRAARAQIRRA